MEKPFNVMILSGGFDPHHVGHCRMFKAAKEMADFVIIGLNSDAWLTRKKGKPFMLFDERREVLEAIRYVDRVWEFNDDDGTACDIINKVHGMLSMTMPEDLGPLKIAFGNGGDRSSKDKIPTAEAELCEKLGVEMVWGVGGEEKAQSSSLLIKNAKEDNTPKS